MHPVVIRVKIAAFEKCAECGHYATQHPDRYAVDVATCDGGGLHEHCPCSTFVLSYPASEGDTP